MRIDNFNLPSMLSAEPKTINAQSSYQQVTAKGRESDISITTAQGDIVTFSQDLFSGAIIDFSEGFAAGGNMQTFTTASLTSESMGFEVKGDLNEEELADIKHLFKDLSNIAQDFFKGDTKGALQEALKLSKHMGSISEVNASFTETTFSSYSQNFHYLPDINSEFAAGFMNMEENEKIEDTIGTLLQSQWQQISDMLTHLQKEEMKGQAIPDVPKAPLLAAGPIQMPTEETIGANDKDTSPLDLSAPALSGHHKNGPAGNLQNHAEKMMAKIAKTLERHPRLSPFTISLADNAIQHAASKAEDNSSKHKHSQELLGHDFMKAYENWLMV